MPNGVVPVGIPGSNLSTLPYPYDTAKATSIVKSLRRSRPQTLVKHRREPRQDPRSGAGRAGRPIGLKVTLTGYEWGTYLTKCSQGTQDQIYRLGWLADYPSMDDFLYPLFQSSVSGANTFTFFSNPAVDQLLSTARGTVATTQRLQIYAQAEKQILADAPVIPLYFYRDYRIMDKRVLRAAARPDGQRRHEPGLGR